MAELALAKDFPAENEDAWRALVDKALRGADFEKALVSQTYDGIRIDPLYTKSDEISAGAGERIAWPGRDGQSWDIRQHYAQSDPAEANAAILADLEGGSSSVSLSIAAPEQNGIPSDETAVARALDGVYLDFAAIALEPGEAYGAAADALIKTWANRGISDEQAAGCFGADPLGTLARAGGLTVSLDQAFEQAISLAGVTRDRFPKVTALRVDGRPYHDGGASEAEELACLCATAVAYLRLMEKAGFKPQQALAAMSFSLAADGDQFLTIAKLRAARALIGRIAEACGVADAAKSCRLHAQTSMRMMSTRDMQVNMLRTTVACAGAAMGGADAITVLPYTAVLGADDAFGRRVARNTQIILAEESALGHVIDPSRGSWYVENLTQELASRAWQLFQEIEQQDGMAKALETGWIQARIRKTADQRANDIAVARQELTGVSAFPARTEAGTDLPARAVPDGLDDPAVTAEPIPLRRPSAPFEILRDTVDAHTERTGETPSICIVNFGRPSDYNERSRYAQNLFAVGGVAATVTDGLDSAQSVATAFRESGTALACLCTSDAHCEDHLQAIGQALTEAGVAHLYLAGRPGEKRETYRSYGVGTFIHRGIDILDVLEETLARIGIENR